MTARIAENGALTITLITDGPIFHLGYLEELPGYVLLFLNQEFIGLTLSEEIAPLLFKTWRKEKED